KADYQDEFFLGSYLNYKTQKQCLVYANSIQEISGYEAFNVIISIPVSDLESLTSLLGDGSKLMLRINDADILTLSNRGMEPDEAVSWERNNKEYINVYRTSGIPGIEYCLLIPQKEFWKESRFVRNMLWVCVSVTLLFGIVGVSVALNRNFKPIAKLVIKVTGEKVGQKNEYDLIENAYTRLNDEKNKLYQHVVSQKEAMERHSLLSMMKGRHSETIENSISIRRGQKIALAAFLVPFLNKQQYKQDELMLFAVDNIFSELVQEAEYYRIEDGQMLFYLFVLDKEGEDWRERCLQRAEQLSTIMKEQFEISVLGAVSNIADDYHDVHLMYQNIIELFETKKFATGPYVIDAAIRVGEASAENAIVQNIKDYIREHDADENLNISTIADGIGKNPKYIARVFKAETKEGLLDYINRIRVEKALSLMQSRQYTVEQVGEMLGYSNSKTFRRVFSKVTGMTPGTYMEQIIVDTTCVDA
ncbi:MAG: AraC family transcriptional regulator, partial [Acetatifactor sp.]|nr:AraC family transcriptional regulator [Acetatifactor sp.]